MNDQLLAVKDETRAAASAAFREAKRIHHLEVTHGRRVRYPEAPTHAGVYFIQCGEWVKIGWSASVQDRLDDLAALNPLPLIGLGFEPLPGGRAPKRERELHEYFALEHHRGEWFRLSDELKRHINEHCKPWPERA